MIDERGHETVDYRRREKNGTTINNEIGLSTIVSNGDNTREKKGGDDIKTPVGWGRENTVRMGR